MYEVTTIGRVGSSKLIKSDEHPTVLNVDLACNRKQGGKDYTDWIAVKIWNDRAEKLEPFIQKGALLYVRGRPEVRGYKRKDDSIGVELVVHASEVEFLSASKKAGEIETTEEE